MKYNPSFTNWLRFAVSAMFLGRAWQYIRFDGPWRQFFWDPMLFRPMLQLFSNQSWNTFISSAATDKFIKIFEIALGLILLFASVSALLINKNKRKNFKIPIYIGWVILLLTIILGWKEKVFQIGYLIEHAAQLAAPLLLVSYFVNNKDVPLAKWLKISIALTFIGHAFYAFGFHPIPGNFIDMFIQVMGVSEPTAKVFLFIAGVLDVVVAIAILMWGHRSVVFIWYAIIWGFLTALARIVANYYGVNDLTYTFDNWVWQFLIRTPHFVLPILLLTLYQTQSYIKKNSINRK